MLVMETEYFKWKLINISLNNYLLLVQKWKSGKRAAEKDKFQGGLFFHTIVMPSKSLDARSVYVFISHYPNPNSKS